MSLTSYSLRELSAEHTRLLGGIMRRQAMGSRRAWRNRSYSDLMMLILGAPAYVAEAAFVASTSSLFGGDARQLVSSAARITRAPQSRRPGYPSSRITMDHAVTGVGTGGFPSLPEEYPPKRPRNYILQEGQVAVRFINSSGDPDVVVGATLGENLIAVATRAGVTIPTACNTGICGTCTTDIEDKNGESYRPGFGIIRACVTKVMLLPGAEEMVVDVYRSKSSKGKLNRRLANQGQEEEPGKKLRAETLGEAMARFAPGWEQGFSPKFKDGKDTASKAPAKVSPNHGRGADSEHYEPRRSEGAVLSERMQNLLAHEHTRDDMPAELAEDSNLMGRRHRAIKEMAQQASLQNRKRKLMRERIHYYLDNADRPIANLEDIMTLTEEERFWRSRFFPGEWKSDEPTHGPQMFKSEMEREAEEVDGRRQEGISIARSAAYRAARQIPRYRFFGDPPLEETDQEYFETREEAGPIYPEEAAEIDRMDGLKSSAQMMKNSFVYRNSRTGIEVPPEMAGKPGTVKSEPRVAELKVCPNCKGTGRVECMQCRAMGFVNADDPELCPRCGGLTTVPCSVCNGVGVLT